MDNIRKNMKQIYRRKWIELGHLNWRHVVYMFNTRHDSLLTFMWWLDFFYNLAHVGLFCLVWSLIFLVFCFYVRT